MTVWLHRSGHGYFPGDRRNLDTGPCPTVLAGGNLGADYWIEDDGKPFMPKKDGKPQYQVPSMDEIRAIPWNGLTVASTFSGAGGSCLGYRMAGFRVVWANEFVPAAQDTYNENKEEGCFLNTNDIKGVTADDVLIEANLKPGELDLFDGSPPCQAFSTAGKRHKNWGKEKSYEHGAKQCNEQLFDEYIRLVQGLQPKVFVAENVSGLIKGTAKGMFLEILAGLKACGYRVRCKVVDAQWLGVPQQRQRTIFVGVREDLEKEPVHPKPLAYRYSVRDALPWISQAIQNPKGQFAIQQADNQPCFTIKAGSSSHVTVVEEGAGVDKLRLIAPSHLKDRKCGYKTPQVDFNKPSPVIMTASPGNEAAVPYLNTKRKFTIAELKCICAFPDDFVLTGSYAQQWERLGNSVPPLMMKAIAEIIRDKILSI